jgi:hypothetical protein
MSQTIAGDSAPPATPDVQPVAEAAPRGWDERFLISLVVIGILASSNPPTGRHMFRQSQVAITVDYLVHGGPWLRYETPVLGPPWSIPLEFPLYQWLAAVLVILTPLTIEQACRIIGETFFLATLLPLWGILTSLKVKRADRLIFCFLLLASPLYVFWSRTVMIESTALFFAMGYLAWVGRYFLQSPSRRNVLGGMLFGITAAIVKVTTFVPFVLLSGLLATRWLWQRWRSGPRPLLTREQIVDAVALYGLPLAGAEAWIRYSDTVKAENPLATELLSRSLTGWTFGTLQQRLSAQLWLDIVFGRTVRDTAGSLYPLLLSVPFILVGRRWRVHYAASLALYVSAFLIFTNLQIRHDYYACANAIFLLGALGFSVVAMRERGGTAAIVATASLVVLLVSCAVTYKKEFLKWQAVRSQISPYFINTVARVTQPDDVLIVYGDDWSPLLPYSLHRRAIMDAENRPLDNPQILASLENVRDLGLKIGGVVACRASLQKPERLKDNLRLLGLDFSSPAFRDEYCAFFASHN